MLEFNILKEKHNGPTSPSQRKKMFPGTQLASSLYARINPAYSDGNRLIGIRNLVRLEFEWDSEVEMRESEIW